MIEKEITEKKTKKAKRSKPTNTVYNPRSEQLCWNCKRCTNPDNLSCSSSSDGIPVEGWTAAPGRTYYS